jgi:hypothetical protein
MARAWSAPRNCRCHLRIKPGDTANLEIWRDGKTKTLGVKVEEFQEETQKVANRDVEEPAKGDKLGLSVRPPRRR